MIPLEDLLSFVRQLELSKYEKEVVHRVMIEIENRLVFLCDVGLGYLTLNRLSSSLSGGESQRINLAISLGSSLVGSMYILDEPSIGLHPRDTHRLIRVLKKLKELGNTVIVVEHDEDIIRASDQIIDIGPLAGNLGGEVVFSGTLNELLTDDKSLTAKYLSKKMSINIPDKRRKWKDFIDFIGCRENNLKHINVRIPLNILTVITGVSGSGKSSLVKGIIYPGLNNLLGNSSEKATKYDKILGEVNQIKEVNFVYKLKFLTKQQTLERK
jgi:excinuclease ABC subunit A